MGIVDDNECPARGDFCFVVMMDFVGTEASFR